MNKLDKHYSSNKISKRLVELSQVDNYDFIIEPSAGSGNISNLLPENHIALDILPDNDNIIKQDFYEYSKPYEQNTLVIGNPPFGYRAQGAISFFNHASKFSDTIAFILPRSFRKSYIINQLDNDFHLDIDENINEGEFETDTKVRCCIQIWKRKSYKRNKIILATETGDFDIIKQGKTFNIDNCTHGIRRTGYGNTVGQLLSAGDCKPITQYIFLNIKDDNVVKKIDSLKDELYKFSYNSCGLSPTFTKGEFIEMYKMKESF